MNAATKRYYLEFGGAMAVYCVTVVVAMSWLNSFDRHDPWRYPVAALPVLPAIAAMVAFVRFLRTMDELQRRIHFEALAIAFGASILITFSYGFLQTAGLPAIPWIWIAPMMIVLWGVTAGMVSRRYA